MVNHMEYDPNFRTFKHVDKFAARGMVKENQREGAKAETEWEMKKSQRREFEKDMPKDNDYFRKMYMNRNREYEFSSKMCLFILTIYLKLKTIVLI